MRLWLISSPFEGRKAGEDYADPLLTTVLVLLPWPCATAAMFGSSVGAMLEADRPFVDASYA